MAFIHHIESNANRRSGLDLCRKNHLKSRTLLACALQHFPWPATTRLSVRLFEQRVFANAITLSNGKAEQGIQDLAIEKFGRLLRPTIGRSKKRPELGVFEHSQNHLSMKLRLSRLKSPGYCDGTVSATFFSH